MNKKSLMLISTVSLTLLLIPLIAMQFTSEVDWGLFDFIIAGILIFGVGVLFSYITRKVVSTKYRVLFIIFVLILFILIWTELGVGIFSTSFVGN